MDRRASEVLREHIRLLHLPTTSCILSFAIIGSVFAPVLYLDRLMWILLHLFFVGGVAANYFDEIRGRPWHTKMSETNLWIIGLSSLITSSLIGLYLTITVAWWFCLFVIVWSFFTVTYDLELFNGRFHNTPSLALCWGSVCLGSYYLQSLAINIQILVTSFITGCIAGYGRDLYELTKPVSKDKKTRFNEANQFAWTLLNKGIVFIDALAIIMLLYRII